MKPGDKVIYFRAFNFEPAPARIGHLNRIVGDTAIVAVDDPGLVTVPANRVHLYTEALWSAWLQWQQNAKQLADQHKHLMAGKAPEALLNLMLDF